MNVAVLLRYVDLKNENDPYWNLRYYIMHDYKLLADKYQVGMIAIMSEYGLDEICSVCDGLIIPGSGTNVNPKYWGGEDRPNQDAPDEYALDSKVIAKFYEAGKPIFGICGGHQGLNIFFGGSLRPLKDKDAHYDRKNHIHPINIEKDSFVYDVFGKERVVTNSLHGKCIDRLAPNLRCVAKSDDGEIEAIEWREKNIFGTQWHPEQTLHGMGDAIEHKFFENFLKSCEECKAKRS